MNLILILLKYIVKMKITTDCIIQNRKIEESTEDVFSATYKGKVY